MNFNCSDHVYPWLESNIHWSNWVNFMGKSIYGLRCDDIEKELCKHGLKANVHRHDCFGVDYYVIEEAYKSVCFDKGMIAKALNIPMDWVDLASVDDMISKYWVKEEELNDKYLDCDGRFCFDELEFMKKKIKKLLNDMHILEGSIESSPAHCKGTIEVKLVLGEKK